MGRRMRSGPTARTALGRVCVRPMGARDSPRQAATSDAWDIGHSDLGHSDPMGARDSPRQAATRAERPRIEVRGRDPDP